MSKGTITKVKAQNGYGFVKVDDGPELFWHASELRGGLEFGEALLGMRVTFEESEGDRGPRAAKIKPAD
jgi:cold shock CspA family protein